jgi:hypothetical protein
VTAPSTYDAAVIVEGDRMNLGSEVPATVERLQYLGDRLQKEAIDDPWLSQTDRVSLLLAASLIRQVADRHLPNGASPVDVGELL